MSPEFVGFQPMLSVWLLYPAFIIALLISVWTYIRYSSITPGFRLLLIVARGLSLTLILLLLMNPQFELRTQSLSQPEITLLIDDSRSISTQRGEWAGEVSMRSILTEITGQLDAWSVRQSISSFSSDITQISSLDELTFDQSETRLYEVLSNFGNNSDLLVLITDGVSTSGRDALFAADFLDIPVYTLAVGDTTQLEDIVLTDVSVPSVAYVNSQLPVRLTVRNEGFESDTISVQILEDNREIAEFSYVPGENRSTREVELLVNPTQTGILNLRAVIQPVSGEWSEENNSRRFSINILDDQIRVAHVGFELHPDVGFLRRLLAANDAIELTQRTWVGNQNFAEGTLPAADSLDLLIIHGLPDGIGQATMQWLESIINEKPVVFFLTPGTRESSYSQLTSSLPGRPVLNRTNTTVPVQLRLSGEASGHAVLDLASLDLRGAPPLRSPLSDTRQNETNLVFLYADVRGETTTSPVLQAVQLPNQRYSFFMAYNIHRWFLRANADQIDWLSQLLYNLIDWTAADPSDQVLELSPIKTDFSSGETIEFRASVTDDSGKPESAAQVTVSINGNDVDFNRIFTMNTTGSGRYELDAGIMPEGSYTFQGTAQRGNQPLGEAAGVFQVGGTIAELVDTRRNDPLLIYLSEVTDGHFSTHTELSDFLDKLQGRLGETSYIQELQTVQLYQSVFWFLLIIVLLSAEWLLRKRYALP